MKRLLLTLAAGAALSFGWRFQKRQVKPSRKMR